MKAFSIIFILPIIFSCLYAQNIDPYDSDQKYAWNENAGWVNMKAQEHGAQVSDTDITGYIWCENIGWVNLAPKSTYPGVGIKNDGNGNLSGLAWGENVGWIKFNPVVPGSKTDYGVKIDSNGYFYGWAWGENIGWINFNNKALFSCGTRVCKVTFDDLANFALYWLQSGKYLAADLNNDTKVNFEDYTMFSGKWNSFCPVGWQLK